MSRYRNDKFNFSTMSERLTFQTQNPDGSYTDNITVWAHILKDGFTRSEHENWFRVMVREQRALESILEVGTRLKWKSRTLSILSWQDPSYEDKGFIEMLTKLIPANEPYYYTDGDLFRDFVSIYRMTKVEVNRFGLISYEYKYDFNTPTVMNVRCSFATDRNMYLEDKKIDVEHDSLIVQFNSNVDIKVDDYIISPIHGKFKVDIVTQNGNNIIEARVQRSEVQ